MRDVAKLKEFLEGNEPQQGVQTMNSHGDFEVLKESPMLGDGKFKLEIGGTCEAAMLNYAKKF